MEIIQKTYTDIPVDRLVKHLNLDEDLVDTLHLESILKSAIDWVETRSNSFIVTTEVKELIYDFTGKRIVIDYKGVNTIDSLKVNDLLVTNYRVEKGYTRTVIIFNESVNVESDIEIIYTAGINPAYNYIQAAIITANDLYDVDRSNYSAGLNNNRTVMKLLNLE